MEHTHALAVLALDGWRPGRAWGRLWRDGQAQPAPLPDYGALLLTLPAAAPGSLDMAPGQLAIFTVRVRFRQGDGYQGHLTQGDGPARPFRSALHLLLLLEGSLAQLTVESEGLP